MIYTAIINFSFGVNMLLQVEKATFSYGGSPLFKDISFSVNEGDRIGLVGDNGCGKSSLFRCIIGEEQISSGQITRTRNLGKLGYVPQNIPENIKDTTFYNYLLEALPEEERDYSFWKVDTTLEGLGVPEEIRNLKISQLSGGWQRLALIARANMEEPDLLLLDEPTNYLDVGKIFKLEKWLNEEVTTPFVVISHDRTFLDNCTKKTMHLRGGNLIVHNLPYSGAREQLLNEDLAAAKARQLEEAEITRIRNAAKRLHIWSNGRNPDMERRSKAIAHRADQLEEQKTEVYIAKKRELEFDQQSVRPNFLMTIHNMEVKTPDGRLLFKIPDMTVSRGDRIAILGMNGTGKTQLLKMLMRAYQEPIYDKERDRSMRFNPQVNIGYFDQHMANMPMKKSISSYIQTFVPTVQEAAKHLVRAGFEYNTHNTELEKLSQGEKARLAFLGLKLGKHNFYIMDEPTNHIDIDGQEKFENSLADEGHTCIFVSHDRYMVSHIANRYFQIDKGILREVPSYENFYEQVIKEEGNSNIVEPKQETKNNSKKGKQTKLDPRIMKELSGGKRK